jgi:hypothetical protein
MPWDDAVTLALTYAEIPYEVVYDEDVLQGKLPLYDWLHLHHEDFTGQYGRFWFAYRNAAWYQEDQRLQEAMAQKLGIFQSLTNEVLPLQKRSGILPQVAGSCLPCAPPRIPMTFRLQPKGLTFVKALFDGDGADPPDEQQAGLQQVFCFPQLQAEHQSC